MCGIYGSTIVYNESQIKDKLKRTAFRGPDQMGCKFYKADNYFIAFGHNRLSIIDLDLKMPGFSNSKRPLINLCCVIPTLFLKSFSSNKLAFSFISSTIAGL